MRMSHNTAMTLDRPTGILTNASMAGNMICTLVLAVSVHRSATLQTCFSAFLKFVLWIPGLTVMFSRVPNPCAFIRLKDSRFVDNTPRMPRTVTGLIERPQTTESNSGCHITCRV